MFKSDLRNICSCVMVAAAAAAAQGLPVEKKPAVLLDGVAAYVNTEMITIAEVMSEVRRSPWADVSPELREKRLRELYTATLNALIDRKLILAAAQKSKMELQSWAVDNRIREIVANNFDGDQTKLHALLADRKIAYEEWRKGIEEDLMITAMRYQQVEKRISPTPTEVREEYEANKGRYQTETAVAVSMIILDPPEREGDPSVEARAGEIAAALKEGKTFASLAKLYSKDAKAAQGGSWGKVNPEDVFRAEIVDALARLSPGEVSPVVTLDGYGYIVRKDEQQDSRMLNFEEAAPYVESHLRMRLAEKIYKEWTDRLRSEAYIKVFELPAVK
ncbi:MAG: peptidyl-prolyl cis-trans isomerase [Kiritimatiellae bacterium]|nr:peptidyl-prolyl cis-trans isomerase [Kiritimatiellia bacterium]MDD3545507.1 peptidyl-prolyl cis-trans isomerase [Kiritimatiellia bacterium]MDD4025065.1 peptidyl-prolyl cis-trans isomerase [Kiritimatiellia bacterium]